MRKLEPSHSFKLSPQEPKDFLTGLFNREAIPDFVIRNGKTAAILDAKFKRHWEKYQDNYDLLTDDIFKCIRDMHLFETDRTGVVFPTENGGILKSATDPNFDLVGVHVPKVKEKQSFGEWSEILDKSAGGILKDYLKILDTTSQE